MVVPGMYSLDSLTSSDTVDSHVPQRSADVCVFCQFHTKLSQTYRRC
jgi:hypothetical protein